MIKQDRTFNETPDILFITPPVWDVHLPFSAVPQLMGACKKADINSMQFDFGITAYRLWFKKHYQEKSKRFFSKKYYNERVAVWRNSPVETYKEYIDKISFLQNNDLTVDKLKKIYKEGCILEKGIINALTDDILNIYTLKSNDGIFDVSDFETGDTDSTIMNCIEQLNILHLFKSDVKLIGISVTGILQQHYMFELIKIIRNVNLSVKIVLGGSTITMALKSTPHNIDILLKYSDFLIQGEGETPIVKLYKHIAGDNISLSEIPGLIYRLEDKIYINPTVTENIENIPEPCFEGIDFNQYLLPEPMMPYQTSRGCFYGRCAFCNHDSGYRHNFRQKSVLTVITEILELTKETGVRHIQFTDEAIKPQFFKQLVYAMEESPEFYDISWFCYLRVSPLYDEETIQIASKNGCRMVMLGIETFEQRLLDFIKKGHNAETSKENLKMFHKHGIKAYAWFMYGLPSQTVDEAINDANSIINISDYLDGFSQGSFKLALNTDMLNNPQKYNIIEHDAKNGKSFKTHKNGILIDVENVRKEFESVTIPFRRKNYFTNNRYVIYDM